MFLLTSQKNRAPELDPGLEGSTSFRCHANLPFEMVLYTWRIKCTRSARLRYASQLPFELSLPGTRRMAGA